MSIESFNETKSKLELFREKIAMIKAIEMAKKKKSKGKDYNPHFDDINPEDLTEDDCEIYKKFEDGSMASEDLEKYRKSVFSKIDEVAGVTEEDRVMHEKFKNQEITRDEFMDYCQKRTSKEEESNFLEIKDSRVNFCTWLINQNVDESFLRKGKKKK